MEKRQNSLSPEARAGLQAFNSSLDSFNEACRNTKPEKVKELAEHNRKLLAEHVSDEQVLDGARAHLYEQVRLARMQLESSMAAAIAELAPKADA